ncbi:hypothetical protein ACFV1X_21670 [Streptomyces coelicoflavus]|uniref:hypothetical protein n=1 Tax=Streptomyces coelicoflavus TaxID=285562 RepID=UPI0036AF76C2
MPTNPLSSNNESRGGKPLSDDAISADVVGVLTEHIEARFGMNMDQLKAAVAAAPTANPTATGVVKWHGMLLEAQAALERAEHDLLTVLHNPDPDAAGPSQDLLDRVDAAVTARDGRAMYIRWALDPHAAGQQDLIAERQARSRGTRRHSPAAPTTAPARPTTPAQPGRSPVR